MIAFKNVYAGYGRTEVLKKISLCFPRGAVTVLIGPNGSGKSTLLKAAAGLLRPSDGEITFDGKNLNLIPRRELARNVSFLPQLQAVFPIAVRDLVRYGRSPHLSFPRRLSGEDERIVQEAMRTVGILELEDSNLEVLSGGERQKAYLAMAIAQDAKAIFWDEPSTYLDISHQFEILSIMRSLCARNRAVVAVMHDLQQAFSVADRVCLLENGAVRAFGTPDEIFCGKELDRVFSVSSERVSTGGKEYILFAPE